MNTENEEITGMSIVPPHSLIIALGMIQFWFLGETGEEGPGGGGAPFRKEVFNAPYVMAYSSLGISSALLDTIVWVLGYVVIGSILYFIQDNYLTEKTTQIFMWNIQSSPLFLAVEFASFSRLLFSTGVCIMMSRYYAGVVPKRAINTIFLSRGLMLLSLSFVVFFILGVIYKIVSADVVTVKLYQSLYMVNKMFATELYIFMASHFKQFIYEAGIIVLLSSLVSFIIPFITAVFFQFFYKPQKDAGL